MFRLWYWIFNRLILYLTMDLIVNLITFMPEFYNLDLWSCTWKLRLWFTYTDGNFNEKSTESCQKGQFPNEISISVSLGALDDKNVCYRWDGHTCTSAVWRVLAVDGGSASQAFVHFRLSMSMPQRSIGLDCRSADGTIRYLPSRCSRWLVYGVTWTCSSRLQIGEDLFPRPKIVVDLVSPSKER